MGTTWPAVSLAAAALGLAACGGGNGDSSYPAGAEKAFLTACGRSSEGKTDACRCSLKKLEERLPFEEFKKADEAIRRGDPVSQKTMKTIRAASSECKTG